MKARYSLMVALVLAAGCASPENEAIRSLKRAESEGRYVAALGDANAILANREEANPKLVAAAEEVLANVAPRVAQNYGTVIRREVLRKNYPGAVAVFDEAMLQTPLVAQDPEITRYVMRAMAGLEMMDRAREIALTTEAYATDDMLRTEAANFVQALDDLESMRERLSNLRGRVESISREQGVDYTGNYVGQSCQTVDLIEQLKPDDAKVVSEFLDLMAERLNKADELAIAPPRVVPR